MSRQSPAAAGAALKMTDADYRALGQFRRAMREFLVLSEQNARDEGLTSQQHQALLAIRAHGGDGPMTIGELADCLMIRNHTAVELVGRLKERGLVERRHSEADRRRVLLELTEAAVEVLEAISARNMRQLHQTAEILAELLSVVERMEDAHPGADADRA